MSGQLAAASAPNGSIGNGAPGVANCHIWQYSFLSGRRYPGSARQIIIEILYFLWIYAAENHSEFF